MIVSHVRTRCLIIVVLAALAVPGAALAQPSTPVRAEQFSPAFLGMYRKVMEIDDEIRRYSSKYGVDPMLARAVCMFESGGNAGLTSGAGARGYFQVMPSTARLMRVSTNIEAGIKYLSQLVRQFGREDYALAAYNGGPGRVARSRAMPLESLQYVLGVGYYRSVLKLYEPSVTAHAAALRLFVSTPPDDWSSLAVRLHVPELQLRLYNPFLTDARLRRGSYLVAYPAEPDTDLVEVSAAGERRYRTRIGDNYINLAFAFGVDVDRLREANGLWRLQVLPANMLLTIPTDREVAPPVRGRTAPDVEAASEPLGAPAPVRLAIARPAYSTHRVRRGETLTSIARRFGTTVAALRRANAMGRRTMIRVGERLRVPSQ
jgi:LysM repeat protein